MRNKIKINPRSSLMIRNVTQGYQTKLQNGVTQLNKLIQFYHIIR